MTKILLVEDDKSLREIYGVRLMAEGYEIVSAGDGEEALAMAIKERPELIVSDVMMPKISGFDMLDILRSTSETKGIKVIMMTALSSEEQRTRGESLGADRYLVKSQVGIEDVVRTVKEVLDGTPATPTPVSAPAASANPATPAPAQTATPTPPADPSTATPSLPPVVNTPPTNVPVTPAPEEPVSKASNATFGERTIAPLSDQPVVQNVGDMINQELSSAGTGQVPPVQPTTPENNQAAPLKQPTPPQTPVQQ